MEMNEKKLKIILRGQREEYQRYLGVLAERFESQVKLVAESVSGIQKQLIALREMVAKNTEDIEMIKTEMLIMKGDMVAMKRDMIEMKADMVAMKGDMVAMKRDMEVMKMDMSAIKNDLKIKTDRDEIVALERRVAFLERKLQKT